MKTLQYNNKLIQETARIRLEKKKCVFVNQREIPR